MATEIVFVAEKAPDGGFVARAVGESIFTQADSRDPRTPSPTSSPISSIS